MRLWRKAVWVYTPVSDPATQFCLKSTELTLEQLLKYTTKIDVSNYICDHICTRALLLSYLHGLFKKWLQDQVKTDGWGIHAKWMQSIRLSQDASPWWFICLMYGNTLRRVTPSRAESGGMTRMRGMDMILIPFPDIFFSMFPSCISSLLPSFNMSSYPSF